jgi:adenine-specific DNA-methyltransferase
MSTPYHAKLWAMELERRAEIGSSETFARALSDAKVDLNPHQVEAAMFAVRSPLAAGAILADEVGLGKTIEAGRTRGQAAPREVTLAEHGVRPLPVKSRD